MPVAAWFLIQHFFCLDEERNIIVGAVNIRHYLNESLFLNGGHIGDGVRPSERRKGIATKMIALALEECKKIRNNESFNGMRKGKYWLSKKHSKQWRYSGKRD